MHLAIDGTLWERHHPDGYDGMALAVLEALGQHATFLGRGPAPDVFHGRWLEASSNFIEKVRPAGWFKRTVPRVMTETRLDRWVSFAGNTAAPGGRIFLKEVSPLLWPETAPKGAADALRAKYAEALEDPATEVLLFSGRAAEILGAATGAASRVHVLPPFWRPAASAGPAAVDGPAARDLAAGGARDAARAKFGQGKEYFLWTGSAGDHWRDTMKAFSQFKLRQRSQMRLVLAPWDATADLKASLETYKFRADVTLLEPGQWEYAALGAYALLYTPDTDELGWVIKAALALETPPIGPARSVGREWAEEAAEWVDPGDPASIAGAMLQLFKDEAYRSRLLARGRVLEEAMDPTKLINRYLCHLS